MQPIGARVIIRPRPETDQTDGGLFVVRDGHDPDVVGTVVALGQDAHGRCAAAWQRARTLFEEARGFMCYEKHTCDCAAHQWLGRVDALLADYPAPEDDVRVGQTVLFPATAGQEITLDDERLIVMPVADVLAVLEEETCG